MLLLRNPVDAAASFVPWRRGRLGAGGALAYYTIFHRTLIPFLDRILICRFEDLVESPRTVVAAVNQVYGASFELPPEDPSKVRAEMELRGAEKGEALRRFRVRIAKWPRLARNMRWQAGANAGQPKTSTGGSLRTGPARRRRRYEMVT